MPFHEPRRMCHHSKSYFCRSNDQPLSLLPTPQSSTLQPPEGTALLTSCSYGMICIFGCAYTLQSENPRSCPSASKKQMHHLGEKAMLPLASFPGVRKIGGSAWYIPFAHAQSLLGNLHTVRYTNTRLLIIVSTEHGQWKGSFLLHRRNRLAKRG